VVSIAERVSCCWLFCEDEDCENVSLLIGSLKSSGTVTSDNFMEVSLALLLYSLLVLMMNCSPKLELSILYFSCVDILGIAIVSSSLTFHCICLVQVCILSCLITIK